MLPRNFNIERKKNLFLYFFVSNMLATPQAVLIWRKLFFHALFVACGPVVDSFALCAGKFYKMVL
jgi:hypothetical protein